MPLRFVGINLFFSHWEVGGGGKEGPLCEWRMSSWGEEASGNLSKTKIEKACLIPEKYLIQLKKIF